MECAKPRNLPPEQLTLETETALENHPPVPLPQRRERPHVTWKEDSLIDVAVFDKDANVASFAHTLFQEISLDD